MELEEKKSAAPEASLPMPELPTDIPAEVRRKLAEDLSEEATEDLKQDVRDAEEEEARDEEVKANPEMLTKSRLLKMLVKKQYVKLREVTEEEQPADLAELLEELVSNGPLAIDWLSKLGVMFDKEQDGTMVTTHGGGTSRKRMHACADYTGAEIMRVLRDEVQNRGIPVLEFAPAVELLLDEEGKTAGAVLWDFDAQEYKVVRAKCVIMATGGAGRLHYQGFPTSNHYGATADGLVMAYRAGAPLIYADAIQYHPTGVAYPAQIYGALVTEKVRSIGAQLVNSEGEIFMHPLETRDVAAASIIRECTARGKGVKALDGVALWLDTPLIEMLHGEGTIAKRIPGMLRMYAKFGIDLRKEPILIYPTLHYQNGGILIDKDAETKLPGLFVAGEAVGGIHGTNRLMGNSLLDIIVFGRIAGTKAAEAAKSVKLGKLSLEHVRRYAEEEKVAGVQGELSPKLLPVYTHGRDVR